MIERWKAIRGYTGLYEISSQGRVRSLDRYDAQGNRRKGRLMRLGLDSSGYLGCALCKDSKKRRIVAHTTVLTTFKGARRKGQQAAHGNGIRTDNCVSNLRWATAEENAADKSAHGTGPQGSRNPRAKLSEKQVRWARRQLHHGTSRAEVARRLSVSWSSVNLILKKETWRHVN